MNDVLTERIKDIHKHARFLLESYTIGTVIIAVQRANDAIIHVLTRYEQRASDDKLWYEESRIAVHFDNYDNYVDDFNGNWYGSASTSDERLQQKVQRILHSYRKLKDGKVLAMYTTNSLGTQVEDILRFYIAESVLTPIKLDLVEAAVALNLPVDFNEYANAQPEVRSVYVDSIMTGFLEEDYDRHSQNNAMDLV